MQIDNQIQALNHAQVKLKTGMITQVDYDSEKLHLTLCRQN